MPEAATAKMEDLLIINLVMSGKVIQLRFNPFAKDYNWLLKCDSSEHKLNLEFQVSLSLLLMSPLIWEKATLAFLNEPYPLGNRLNSCREKRAYQMFLTWFGFPKSAEELKNFVPNTWQKLLLEDHTHLPEQGSKICTVCGIFCPSAVCSSDDEEEQEDLCLCGMKVEKCKCKKCKICKLKELDCKCLICLDCGKCTCTPKSAHRKQHQKPGMECVCKYCDGCGEKKCICSDSSDSVLY